MAAQAAFRGFTSAVTLANLLNMHCHSMPSRSGQPRVRLAACQAYLAPLNVHAPWTYQRRRGTAPGVRQQAPQTSPSCRHLDTRDADNTPKRGRFSRTTGRALWEQQKRCNQSLQSNRCNQMNE
jgi:hypothetical protein